MEAGLAAAINRDWLIGALLRQTTQSDRQVEAIFRFMCNVSAPPSAIPPGGLGRGRGGGGRAERGAPRGRSG